METFKRSRMLTLTGLRLRGWDWDIGGVGGESRLYCADRWQSYPRSDETAEIDSKSVRLRTMTNMIPWHLLEMDQNKRCVAIGIARACQGGERSRGRGTSWLAWGLNWWLNWWQGFTKSWWLEVKTCVKTQEDEMARVTRVQERVATQDWSRCTDFAYDPELGNRESQQDLGELIYVWGLTRSNSGAREYSRHTGRYTIDVTRVTARSHKTLR